jgi:hypothetical protein
VRDAWTGRQAKLLAHVHPAVETEGEVERVEHQVARAGIEIAELGREPHGEALAQKLAQLRDTEADRRRYAAHALGEVPHRQPLLEELGAVRHQKLDAVGQRRRGVDRAVAIEGAADREIERRRVEVGQAGEVLEQCAAGNAGNGRDGCRSRLDIAGLDQVQSRLDESLARPQAAHDAAVLRTRNVDRESDNFHIETNRIRIALMRLL